LTNCEGPFAVSIGCARAFLSVAVALSLLPRLAEAKRPVRSLAEIRQEGVVMQKWDLSCGSAALATLLTYDFHDPVNERAVATAMLHRTDPVRVRVRGGFSLLELQEYAEGRGYETAGYGEMILEDLPAKLPAIVPLQLHGYDHFVVVREVRDGEVIFADPAYGKRRLSVAAFERAWVQKVAFVIEGRHP
jgi:uncharacterized protein